MPKGGYAHQSTRSKFYFAIKVATLLTKFTPLGQNSTLLEQSILELGCTTLKVELCSITYTPV